MKVSLHVYFKLLADDIQFSIADDFVDESEWAYQWEMSFNPDRIKPPHEVIFSRKTKILFTLIFTLTKHLDLTQMRSLRLTIT